LKLAEYEFEIINRPGKKHINAGVLSRHVAAAVRKRNESHSDKGTDVKPQAEVSLSKDVIRQAQGKDEFCQQVIQALFEGKQSPYLWVHDTMLYYQSPNATEGSKIIVPASLREQVIRQHHDSVFASQQGEKRTVNSLRLHYYWPSMWKDVEKFIQKYTSCAIMKKEELPSPP